MEKKVYLEESELKQLKLKAEGYGFTERGWLSNLLRFLAKTEFAIINQDLKKVLSMIDFKKS